MIRPSRKVWWQVVCVVIAMVAVGAARAQDGQNPDAPIEDHAARGWPYRSIPRALLDSFIEDCGLSEAQAEAARTLFTSYELRIERANRKLSAFNSAVWRNAAPDEESQRDKRLREGEDAFQEFLRRSQESLLRDWSLLIEDGQQPGWTRFDRRFRRWWFVSLPYGTVTGAEGDLAAMFREALGARKAPEGAAAVLVAYEIELDRLIRERVEQELAESAYRRRMLREPLTEEQMLAWEADAARAMVKRDAISRRQREINLKYLTALVEFLEPGERAVLEDRYYSANLEGIALYEVDAARRVEGAIATVNRLHLTDEQRKRVDELERDFLARSRDTRRKCFEALLRWSRKAEDARNWDEVASEAEQLNAAHRQWCERVLQTLRDSLTEEQLLLLPPPLGVLPEPNLDFEE